MRRVLLALVLLAVAGAAAAQVVNHDIAVQAIMATKVNPAALAFWAGGNDPPEGEKPAEADARWAEALKGAQALQAGGKQLLQHSRPGRWDEFAKLLIEGGEKGEAAARAKNVDEAFTIGGDQVYNACNGCHKTYIPSPVRPQ
jgi:cytochrome c556